MIEVGIVGLGFMGMIHYLSYQKIPGVRVAAICETNEKRLTGDWTDIKGNFGPAGEQMDLSGVATFTSLDEMLASTKLDVVDVTLPPALHAQATLKALAAGKHVFCEKPMSLSLAECQRMSAAAKAADRRLCVGHVLPFFPEYAWAYEAATSGRYGALRGGAFRRVISNPAWLTNYWKADQVGGPLFDLHVHDAHFIRLLFGMPSSVVSRGRTRDGLPEFWHSFFSFPNSDYVVEATSGTTDQQGRAFNHGFEIHLERATLLFEFSVLNGQGAYLCPPTILDENGNAERVELGSGDPMDAFAAELRNVIESVRKNQESEILNGRLAEDAVKICDMEAASIAASRVAS
ncbi:Gfo/Idh/MocA family protein [Lacipirellula limnantheis]|uniref:Glucose--fructose oxidoreductase n=1 Tax=Lacipirellula limnantheis TaxID=2528024 RepID=A0A517TVN2_9BACT|nr:Gfo/Idh/MocA family oxidoreductase [Lacipirellula limnantheis]QDT72432.1 Glucose--fructose oxidoreductase precursor [Lacipirellula limnantheis]